MKMLVYCNRQKPLLYKGITAYTRSVKYVLDKEQYLFGKIETLNGKIVLECDYEVEEINDYIENFNTRKRINTILKDSQLFNWDKLFEYEKFYRIHIKNLKERIMELSDYCLYPKNIKGIIHFVLEGTPYIVLSVSPEEMCRICNGEQTDLFKKRILKEML